MNGTSNTIAFENVFDSAYKEFIITGHGIRSAGSGDSIALRFGNGATPSYLTSNYHITQNTAYVDISASSNVNTSGASVNQTYIAINRGLSIPSSANYDVPIAFKAIILNDLNDSLFYKRVLIDSWGGEDYTYLGYCHQVAMVRDSNVVTGIQFFTTSSNNFYGTLTLYGVK